MSPTKTKLLKFKLSKVKQIKALKRLKFLIPSKIENLISKEIEKEERELDEINNDLAKLK